MLKWFNDTLAGSLPLSCVSSEEEKNKKEVPDLRLTVGQGERTAPEWLLFLLQEIILIRRNKTGQCLRGSPSSSASVPLIHECTRWNQLKGTRTFHLDSIWIYIPLNYSRPPPTHWFSMEHKPPPSLLINTDPSEGLCGGRKKEICVG